MPAEKESIRAGLINIRFLLEGEHSTGGLAMFEFTVPAGANVSVPNSLDRNEILVKSQQTPVYARGRKRAGWQTRHKSDRVAHRAVNKTVTHHKTRR